MTRFLLVAVLLVALVGVVSADTLIVYSYNQSQRIFNNPSSLYDWYTIRNGPGTVIGANVAYTYAQYAASTTEDLYDYEVRTALSMDTASIPDDATISNVTISIRYSAKTNGLGSPNISFVDFNAQRPIPYLVSDFSRTTYTRYTEDCPYSSFTGAWNTIPYNAAGISSINKSGYSNVMMTTNWTVDNQSPTWASGASTKLEISSGFVPANAPYLTIEYTTTPWAYTPPYEINPSVVTDKHKSFLCNIPLLKDLLNYCDYHDL